MNQEQRAELMIEAIRQLSAEGEGFVIFTDQRSAENFIQLTSDGIIEATSRNYRSSKLPRLTEAQVQQLVTLGFSAEASPNHSGEVDLTDPAAAAARCEAAFAVLGVAPDFVLEVESGL